MCSSRNSHTRTGGVGAKCWLTCKLRDDPLGSQARAKQQGVESRLKSDRWTHSKAETSWSISHTASTPSMMSWVRCVVELASSAMQVNVTMLRQVTWLYRFHGRSPQLLSIFDEFCYDVKLKYVRHRNSVCRSSC